MAASYFTVFIGIMSMALFLAISLLLVIIGIALFVAKLLGYLPEPQASA
jgi:hypothetical protein